MKKITLIYLIVFVLLTGSFGIAKSNPVPVAFPISKVIVGTVDNPADFTGSVTMHYDGDSVYMHFVIVDDSIVNYFFYPNAYQVDNIEIYFDMDNSKNIHWPRNGGWIKEIDDSYDLNDYQIRLVPGITFLTYNFHRPEDCSITDGYRLVYKLTNNGYDFIFNIAWNRLMNGFVAGVGKRIGFDILASDNDKFASEANRNQITWNSPTDKPYNDPSLFGTLELAAGGVFNIIKDTTNPTTPGNLAVVVDSNEVLLTWDASTDNIAVMSYIIYKNDDSLTTVYANKTFNYYLKKKHANGTYTYKVRAVDNYGNRSALSPAVEATIDYTLSSHISKADRFVNYPNPVGNMLIFENASDIAQVELLGMNGTVIFTVTNSTGKQIVLNTSYLSKGIYLVRLTTTDSQIVVSKIVKA